jgi:GNAT superfamily N-acetyltransferase
MYPRGGIEIAPGPADGGAGRGSFLATLLDGTSVLMRPVTPDDKWRIEEGLARMSPHAVYRRFCRHVARLSETELRYLTEVDQVRHIAWGAVDPEEPSQPGVGIGRLICEPGCPTRAEAAVTVIDPYRGVGLGTLLLATLCALGQQRGIRTLRACILPENSLVLGWFRRLGAHTVDQDDSMVTLDLRMEEFRQRVPTPFAELLHRVTAILPGPCA